jgi:hypothetical protein
MRGLPNLGWTELNRGTNRKFLRNDVIDDKMNREKLKHTYTMILTGQSRPPSINTCKVLCSSPVPISTLLHSSSSPNTLDFSSNLIVTEGDVKIYFKNNLCLIEITLAFLENNPSPTPQVIAG